MKVWDTVNEYYGAWKGLSGAGYVDLLTQLAHERLPGTANQFGVTIPEWQYSEIDHADTSPIAVSGGVAAIVGKIWCNREAFAGSPDIDIMDDTTELWTLDAAMALRAVDTAIEGTKCATDLNVVINSAGTAGKFIIQWRPLA